METTGISFSTISQIYNYLSWKFDLTLMFNAAEHVIITVTYLLVINLCIYTYTCKTHEISYLQDFPLKMTRKKNILGELCSIYRQI